MGINVDHDAKNESRGLMNSNYKLIANMAFHMFGLASMLICLWLFCGCESQSSRVSVEKTISEKLASTEQRLGFDAFDTNNGFRSRATTVYYLIAEDGTMIEVTLQEYARVKIGQAIHSDAWR